MVASEHDIQETVFAYCHGLPANLDKRLSMLFVIANGAWKGRGRMEAGMVESAGIPDLMLPVPVHSFHGLFLELKTAKGRPSAKQKAWQKKLRENGYASEIVYGADAAIDIIELYLSGGLPPF